MKKYHLLLIILLILPLLSYAQHTDKIERIDSILTYLHQRQLFNGAVLIGEKGSVLYKKAFGIAHPETREPLTTASAFNLASVSKQFYTMMVMILREQGKLSYDHPVRQYLPTFPYPDITIRHLMNQTSGLPEYFDIALGDMNLLDTLTNEAMLDLLAAKQPPLVFAPGEQWQYSNTNYTTLASVIEQVSGLRVDQFFERYIARPLGMSNSYVYHLKLGEAPASRVYGLRYEGGRAVLNDLVRIDGIAGDGNIYASAEDLYRWDQALYSEKLVSTATFSEAITPGRLNDGSRTSYGFGWFIDTTERKVAHSGGWVGFRTYITRYLDKEQAVIVLDNSSNYLAHALVRNVWEGKPIQLPTTHLITNVRLVDGTGLPAYEADVRILNDRIRDIGELDLFPGESMTDGEGMVLAPGFIDSHSHHDWGLKDHPAMPAATSQGITTIIVGQDGGSTPIDTIIQGFSEQAVGVNLATYTGHAWLREQVMGQDLFRKATEAEIDSMKTLLSRELDKGSLGLSTGLEYEEAFYSTRDEVVALAKTAATKGGRYISHIRSEDISIEEAIEEIIEIGRQADIPVQISHIKVAMRSKWGDSRKLLAQLQSARQSGVDITADVYPYPMWLSTPRVLFPKKDFDNLASAEMATRELFDPAASIMLSYPPQPELEGKTVAEIAALHNEPPARGLMRIIRESKAAGTGSTIMATSMSETDISNFLLWPHSNICSDGTVSGHPRGHGAFTRVLGRYVREQQLMPLETAIYKMTGLTAEHVGIEGRGIITPGYFADLVLFDPDTVMDNATASNPTARSTGIRYVWVNGQLVYQHTDVVPNYPGRFIKRR